MPAAAGSYRLTAEESPAKVVKAFLKGRRGGKFQRRLNGITRFHLSAFHPDRGSGASGNAISFRPPQSEQIAVSLVNWARQFGQYARQVSSAGAGGFARSLACTPHSFRNASTARPSAAREWRKASSASEQASAAGCQRKDGARGVRPVEAIPPAGRLQTDCQRMKRRAAAGTRDPAPEWRSPATTAQEKMAESFVRHRIKPVMRPAEQDSDGNCEPQQGGEQCRPGKRAQPSKPPGITTNK